MLLPMACSWAEEQGAIISRDGVPLTLSQLADARHTVSLEWRREESGGNRYFSPQFDMEGWLCPALFKYFASAPRELFGRAEPKTK